MTQWEYLYLVADRDEVFKVNDQIIDRCGLPTYLNRLGLDSWEMVGVTTESGGFWRMVFKRPKDIDIERDALQPIQTDDDDE